jgi:DNA polymerase-3 subunit epsilon
MEMNGLLERPLSEVPFVVLDTETTGLSPTLGHRIVEVAAIRFHGWREIGRLEQLVNPGRPIDPGASRVNGIFDEDVADAPPFSSIAGPLQTILDGALIVAHTASFDADFLCMEYALLGQADQDEFQFPNPWLCTLRLSRGLFHFGRNSLGHVARNLGVRTRRSHRALGDAYTTAEVLKRMVPHFDRRQLHTVGELLQAQGGAIRVPQKASPSLPPPLAQALARQCSLRIRYVSGKRETERVISPLYSTSGQGNTYLVAYCHLRRAQRTFRLDRIERAELLESKPD